MRAADRQIGKCGEDRGQIVAHSEFQPATAFRDRKNGCDHRSRLWAAYVDPVLSTESHRMHRLLPKPAARGYETSKLLNWIAAEADVTTDLYVTSDPCFSTGFLI